MGEGILADLRERRLRARAALERAGTLAFKPVSSAQWVNVQTLRSGAIRVQIEHDTLRGVTPQMMRWWFENLAGSTTWNGVDFTGPQVSHYHLWHHRDHIAVTPRSSTSAPGAEITVGTTFTIDEIFNDFHDRIHATVTTTRLDEEEFTFDIIKAGVRVGRIVHLYGPVPGGLRFYAETTIGFDSGPARIANVGRPLFYSARTAENWIQHNIEETGRSEDILPQLYSHATNG
ncbi:MAG: hypothetical protein PGN27_09340 [Mycolicibacterium neoaurum]|uniref:DAPG hydrolase family protein n=1 Tax=Mycolicibacterium neoaurum TaxID=1795 RepID=UPI002FF74EF5